MKDYTIRVYPPENKNQLWGVWCEELELMSSGESENEAFYNLIENIPVYFQIKNENQRHTTLIKNKTSVRRERTFKIPAFA